MKFLIDTNIFIPIEIVSEADVEPNTPKVTLLSKNIRELGNQLYVHPAQKIDIENDVNETRKKIRKHKFGTYPSLDDPPKIKKNLKPVIGDAERDTNDWVDNNLIASVYYNAVDFLITEDTGLLKKAESLQLRDRIVNLDEAIEMVDNLFDKTITPPPAVELINAYELNSNDPIFEGLRQDYPGFDGWLEKCMRENRPTFVVKYGEEDEYAAVCILKKELNNEFGLEGKVYKICTFKVVNRGIKLGELLLKTIFEYSHNNDADFLYVEVYPKYEYLIDLFKNFGFFDLERDKHTGELRYVKKLTYNDIEKNNLSPLNFNIKFGPQTVKTEGASCFVIPIIPEYHQLLFPEAENQRNLFPGKHSYGNSIRKAYLSNSNTRKIKSGDIVLFYRSKDLKKITAIGVAEQLLVSQNPNEIARFVGRRTVYSLDEIKSLCLQGEVLSILFRQVSIVKEPYSLKDLVNDSILRAAPQSITKLNDKIKPWIKQILKI